MLEGLGIHSDQYAFTSAIAKGCKTLNSEFGGKICDTPQALIGVSKKYNIYFLKKKFIEYEYTRPTDDEILEY